MSLIRLAYYSTAVAPMTAEDLNDLCCTASAHNRTQAITGVLVYADNHFFQILEGDGRQLDPLLERVIRDCRHTNVHITARQAVDRRAFAEWGMKHCDVRYRTPVAAALRDLVAGGRTSRSPERLTDNLIGYMSAFYTATHLSGMSPI